MPRRSFEAEWDTLKQILREWAAAYRTQPQYRFPSDPNAEFFSQDLDAAANEIKRLRTAIKWALGEGPDENGMWFGDSKADLFEGTKSRYWWRKHLKRLAGHEQKGNDDD